MPFPAVCFYKRKKIRNPGGVITDFCSA